MPNLEVVFHVPNIILRGLASGQLERVGGVIRDVATKQVVTWLRDTGVWNSTDELPQPLDLIMGAARAATTLHDGRQTRRMIVDLSDQVRQANSQINEVSQQVASVKALNTFIAGGQIINFAMSAVSLFVTLKRLDQLSAEIIRLGDLVQSEFRRDRDMGFKVAIQAARDAFESDLSTYQDNAARSAIDGLYEARENFLTEYDQVMKISNSGQHLMLAKHYLIRALYAESSRIRCYLITRGSDIAQRRLMEDLPRIRESSKQLVTALLGQKSAIYFHKDVPSESLDRFLQLQRWLKSPDLDEELDESLFIFEVMDRLRADFWNSATIQDEYGDIFSQITRRPVKSFIDHLSGIPERLANAEMVVENYHHLLGFNLEMQSMRLSLPEWEQLATPEMLQYHDGFAMIVDADTLQTAERRLSI